MADGPDFATALALARGPWTRGEGPRILRGPAGRLRGSAAAWHVMTDRPKEPTDDSEAEAALETETGTSGGASAAPEPRGSTTPPVDSGTSAPSPRRAWRLRSKLLLALTSFVGALLLLELAAGVAMSRLGPVQVREGLYDNPLPLFTGHGGPAISLRDLPDGERMPRAKPADEVRIFIVGESSVAGSPLDVHASVPAMVVDELRARMPDRQFAVVNMGRPGSVSANAFYYTQFIGHYDPDFIVYFMGHNDTDALVGEQCLPVTSPRWHGLWRSAVRRSQTLWLVRTFGVQLLWAVTERGQWYSDERCPDRSFHLWTRILVEEAERTGATVIIPTPVVSAALDFEANFRGRERSGGMDLPPLYRDAVACALEDDCDLGAHLSDVMASNPPCIRRTRRCGDGIRHGAAGYPGPTNGQMPTPAMRVALGSVARGATRTNPRRWTSTSSRWRTARRLGSARRTNGMRS